MGNCRDCKHWGDPVGQFEPWSPGPGLDARYCEKVKDLLAPFETYQAYPPDQVNLPIATSPDFGCVQFEPKEAGR